MSNLLLIGYVVTSSALRTALRRAHVDERGEGVISAAIAVLIMAFLGAGMWAVFHEMFDTTTKQTGDQITRIGQ